MPKISSIIKNKKVILIIIVIFFIVFVALWNVVSGGYDKQDKTILLLKKFIPKQISRKVRDTIFIIPDLKERNKFLSTQVKKFEQGFNGELFNEEIILTKKNKKKYSLKEFFLPFPRLDGRLGWSSTKNSKRAHHFAIIKENVIVISGEGKTIYFKKNNILNKKLNQIVIPNNIQSIINENNSELIGIRDLFLEDEKIYISLIFKNLKGLSINVYKADVNFEKLNFELFFETGEYWDYYNVYSGGRLSTYKDNKILFTIGYSHVQKAAQQLDSLLGKIISIDKLTGEHKIISMGHRNPQGLYYVKDSNIIINTEHGPKGGDEINISHAGKNYGWPTISYGKHYSGEKVGEGTHKTGYEQPIYYWDPSIAPSGLLHYRGKAFPAWRKNLFVGALKSQFLGRLELKNGRVIREERLFVNELGRIRDVREGPNGHIYFLTDGADGKLIRISPK